MVELGSQNFELSPARMPFAPRVDFDFSEGHRVSKILDPFSIVSE